MLKYFKNELFNSKSELDSFLASYEPDNPFLSPTSTLDGRAKKIYNDGNIQSYEFVDQYYHDYVITVTEQAAIDLAADNTQPYENDPELWLDAILRPARKARFQEFDYIQGRVCWARLTDDRRKEYTNWHTRMLKITDEYPTYTPLASVVWPILTFAGC